MPGGGGQAVLEAARALAVPPPVIIMTGQTDPRAEAELMKRGARVYLRKPFGFRDVIQAIAEVVRES